MAKNDFKNLSPQERLKKLKELEQEKKKEIAEARKLIKESEKDITAEHQFKEKVPIPEVGLENLQGLSEEGRQLLMVLKDLKEKKNPKSVKETKKVVSEESLEETIQRIDPIPIHVKNTEYALHLSQRPMQDLQNQMAGIYEISQERGYMTQEDQKKVAYISAGVHHKMEAIDNGLYTTSDDLTSKVKATKELSAHMLGGNPDHVYHATGTKETQRDRYTGREV
ncbi:hypothetical protein HQ489_01095 [Candidatus Woesearchaeota archaeon]|nr:hypothetical protein [Candidatus Woesearchaeota archaeon]